METKHTPGPWVCHSGMVWKPDGSEDGIPIAHMDRSTPATRPTERDANARLIAAAPEMYEALRAIVAETDNLAEIVLPIDRARAAIRKVEGV